MWDQVEKIKLQVILACLKQLVRGKQADPDDMILSYLIDCIKSLEWAIEAFKGAVCISKVD